MSNYKVMDKHGNVICVQQANSAKEAVYSAKNYYGHKGAVSAVSA